MKAVCVWLAVMLLAVPAVGQESPASDSVVSDHELMDGMMAQALARDGRMAAYSAAETDEELDPPGEPAPAERAEEPDEEEPAPEEAATGGRDELAARPPLSIEGVNLSGSDVEYQTVGSDTIIITGNEEDVAMLEAIVGMLDEEGPRKDLRVVTLEKAGAKRVAEKIQSIYAQLARPDDKVSAVDVAPTVVVVSAPAHLIEEVVGIIHTIDVHSTLVDTETMIFQVQHRKASEAAEQLKNVLDTFRRKQGEEAGPEFEIIPIDANNTIMIAGPESEREKIQRLLDSIDVEPAEGWGDIMLAVFPLYNSDPTELADTINELIEQQASTGGKAKAGEEAIRRLRMVIRRPGKETVELPPLDLEKPLRIIPDEGTGSLIVATVESNIEPMGGIVEVLDDVPGTEEIGMEVFRLRFADAESLSELIKDMFDEGKDLPKPAPGSEKSEAVPEGIVGEALVYNITLATDLRTNTLLVAGKSAQVLLVKTLVAQLDVPSAATKFPLRLITMANTDATHMGKIVEQLFEQRIESLEKSDAGKSVIERERVFLSVDIRSNSLIVSASEENYAEIVEITTRLDSTGDRLVDNIRILNCDNTSAADLASKIDELWQRKADLRSEGELPPDLPVIVADTRSNSMVIASSPEDYEEILRLVQRLESQPLAPIAQIRLIKLENNDAGQIGDMLKQLFEERMEQRLTSGQEENPADRVALANDSATNMILVASSKENYDEMMRIVEAIDVEPDVEGVVQFYVLHNAEATNVAEKIDELFEKGLYDPSVGIDNPLVEERKRVTVLADPRSNAVIASASKPNLAIVERLIEQMDSETAPLLDHDTQVFQLGATDAIRLAGMLEDLFDGIKQNAPEPDLVRPPTIIADDRSNALFVTGSRDSLKRCADLITRIEEQGVQRTAIFEIYELQHAAAAPLAEKMQETFDQREQGGSDQGERTPIYIMPEESTNSLICSASRDDHEVIASLLKLLDKPSNIAKQFEIFPLKIAKAEPVAERLENLFKSQASGAGGSARADAIAVEPDPRTNSLVVWAAPSQMQNVRVIVSKMDTQEPLKEMQMRAIRLKHAKAEDFSQVFTETLFGGESTSNSDDQESVIVVFREEMDDGRKVERKLLRQDITITGDPRTNALMVLAPASSMDMLEQLIREIDKMPPQLSEIRLFPLVNADAEEMVEKLQELFEPDTGADGELDQQLVFGEGGSFSVTASGEGSSVVGIRFTADRRTNTVIAAGGETDLNMAERTIRLIDSQTVDERITEVYLARYVPAMDLTSALKDFVDEENDRLSALDDESSVLRQAEKHVTIIGDEGSNTVLVGVSPRYRSQVMDMLRRIDRPPPQVMIQVLIAEVTLDDSVEFGMEFALQDLTFTESAFVGPNGVIKGNNFDFVGGVDVGASGGAGSFGGFSFSITGEDFNFLLRALQSDGVLEVLQRPTLLVENNEEAELTIGDRVPFVRNSSVSDSGQVNSSVEYEKVGVILKVTPHINPDGYVNLEVAPEISALNPSGSGVQISEGLVAPTFSERSMKTVVTAKDGETVVLGGLINTREDQREVKVPILGDIPGLGLLFRSTTSQRKRSELLIVLTVDVVRDEYDAYRMSVEQRDKSGLLTDRILQSPLMEGLRIRPEDDMFGPRDEGDYRESAPQREQDVPEDRELYGPTPDVYGPVPPRRIKVEESEPVGDLAEVYGPVLPARLVATKP